MYVRNFEALATTPARRLALELAERALAAVMPDELVRQRLRRAGERLVVSGAQPLDGDGRRSLSLSLRGRRVWLLGAGKASAAMAAALEELIGPERVHGGLVITVSDATGPRPTRIPVVYGGHPLPSRASVVATQKLLKLAAQVRPDDLVLWLISGGASALLAAPAEGITLAQKQRTTRVLLRSGATIDELNAVRKHLSAVKGGQLARLLAPAQVVTLALSDVVSGRLDVIGSGPTVPDASTYSEALAVLQRYGLRTAVPTAVRARLEAGAAGKLPETPKLGEPYFETAGTVLLGGPHRSAQAAAGAARQAGLRAEVLTDQLAGEAREVARVLGGVLRYRAGTSRRPLVLVASGETTVTVRGNGKGGRNQELAAALIPEIAGLPDCAILCLATDGYDFVPGVGGALVGGDTADAAIARGLSMAERLADNDAFPLHQRLGTLLEMAPTGTNVCDLVVCVLGAHKSLNP